MRTMLARGTAAAALGTVLALAGCGPPKELSVDGGWVRLGAVQGRPAAAYFTLHGGPTDATLINVTTDVAIKSEMHESMGGAGMAAMTPLPSVAVPAHATVVFRPGGRHVMLHDVNPGIRPGRQITFTFTFADGLRIQQNAGVIAAGDPAPK